MVLKALSNIYIYIKKKSPKLNLKGNQIVRAVDNNISIQTRFGECAQCSN